MRFLKHNKGFTLIEVLVSLTILGILSVSILVYYSSSLTRLKKTVVLVDTEIIVSSIYEYFNESPYELGSFLTDTYQFIEVSDESFKYYEKDNLLVKLDEDDNYYTCIIYINEVEVEKWLRLKV